MPSGLAVISFLGLIPGPVATAYHELNEHQEGYEKGCVESLVLISTMHPKALRSYAQLVEYFDLLKRAGREHCRPVLETPIPLQSDDVRTQQDLAGCIAAMSEAIERARSRVGDESKVFLALSAGRRSQILSAALLAQFTSIGGIFVVSVPDDWKHSPSDTAVDQLTVVDHVLRDSTLSDSDRLERLESLLHPQLTEDRVSAIRLPYVGFGTYREDIRLLLQGHEPEKLPLHISELLAHSGLIEVAEDREGGRRIYRTTASGRVLLSALGVMERAHPLRGFGVSEGGELRSPELLGERIRLALLHAGGETSLLELKAMQLPGAPTASESDAARTRGEILRTVAGFANTHGGVLVMGVPNRLSSDVVSRARDIRRQIASHVGRNFAESLRRWLTRGSLEDSELDPHEVGRARLTPPLRDEDLFITSLRLAELQFHPEVIARLRADPYAGEEVLVIVVRPGGLSDRRPVRVTLDRVDAGTEEIVFVRIGGSTEHLTYPKVEIFAVSAQVPRSQLLEWITPQSAPLKGVFQKALREKDAQALTSRPARQP